MRAGVLQSLAFLAVLGRWLFLRAGGRHAKIGKWRATT